MITGDSRKRKGYSGYEVTVNTSEAIDTGLGTSRSPKGKEAIEDIRNISVGRKYECKLCFSVLRNKLIILGTFAWAFKGSSLYKQKLFWNFWWWKDMENSLLQA